MPPTTQSKEPLYTKSFYATGVLTPFSGCCGSIFIRFVRHNDIPFHFQVIRNLPNHGCRHLNYSLISVGQFVISLREQHRLKNPPLRIFPKTL